MIDLLFAGDTFLKTNNSNNDESPFTESIKCLFKASKHVCINLETTLGDGGEKVAKAYTFRSSPKSLKYLLENNVFLCSLANNHSNDYGKTGLIETRHILESKHISYIGTNDHNPIIIEINGKRIALCSYYGNVDGLAPLKKTSIEFDIKQFKQFSDIVVVCLHWGQEYVAYPSPKQQSMARGFIDAGASVIIGHHPHVMQGYEEYNGGFIFYSLGNFNFFVDHPYAKKLIETTKAYCVGLNIHENGVVSCSIIPVQINEHWQPSIIEEIDEKKTFLAYLNKISEPLHKKIRQLFYLSEVAPHFFSNNLPSWKKRIKEHGVSQVTHFLIWLIHPTIYKYYVGGIISFFHKSKKYL